MAFVQQCAGAPVTSNWRRGEKVRGSKSIARGTAIATFDAQGQYANHATGNHAAIYISHDDTGIVVYDQWRGQPVHQRRISYKGGTGSPSNDGDVFYVIE